MSLNKVHGNLRKYYGLFTIICVIIGFLFPQFSILSPYIPFLLAVLVFSMVIEHKISDFTRVVKHPKIVMALIASNLILYPVIGILIGYWLIPQNEIMIGIILLCFAPSPVVAALWTELSGGDGTISISTALFSMMLSIIVYPVVLFFMGITSPELSISIFKLLALSIFVPAIVALFLRIEEERYIPAKNTITLLSSLVGLLIIVVAIAHMASRVLANELNIILILTFITVILLTAGFVYGHLLGKLFKTKNKDGIGFLYISSMRDGIIPLSIAITYFSSYSTMPATILLIVMPFMVVGVYYLVRK
jgi:BASS family bile acid:Na+ symporter